ncbi:hypothetical protein [uncultured Chryseobacterium sp.]|uniref:hypothetical protein n=1 Tax=uncultured Chryseobacterium sp. TaxID=259322 RepID=UPI0025DD4B4E|nr:hypothetical protein [uncultured Chryseobacterium sp.]
MAKKIIITEKNVSEKVKQFNAGNLTTGRAYIIGEGWQDIQIDEAFYNKSIGEIVALIGGRPETAAKVKFKLRNEPFHHWSASRFVWEESLQRWAYIAGQDYPAEITQIRNFLKK